MHGAKPRRRQSIFACLPTREASVLPFVKSSSGPHLISFIFLFISSQLFLHIHTALSRRLSFFFSLCFRQILNVKDHPDHQTATRAHSDLFAVSQVVDCDLKAVAAGTRVCVGLQGFIVGHVLVGECVSWISFWPLGGTRRTSISISS
jgi:hypothetical protein